MSDSTSKAIYWLQVFLAIMVVVIHSTMMRPESLPLNWLSNFLDPTLTMPVLGCYFLLSGYVMFARFDRFGLPEYKRVVTRRLVSLVLPWILWCIIGYVAYIVFEPAREAPDWWRLDRILLADRYAPISYRRSGVTFWAMGTPFGNGVMYCIRDIFILALLSPLIWWGVKGLRLWAIPLCIIFYFLFGNTGIGAWKMNWIFFPIGAALSICRVDPGRYVGRWSWWIVVLWLCMAPVVTYVYVNFDWEHIANGLLTRTYVLLTKLVGVTAFLVLAYKATRGRNPLLMTLLPFAFFIIAIHQLPFLELPLMAASEATIRALGVHQDWMIFTNFFYLVPVRLAAIFALATLIERLSPRLMSLLTGARSLR